MLLALTLASVDAGAEEITPRELLAAVKRPDAPLVLDARSAEEYAGGHMPGARNIAYDQVAARLGELGPAREVVVYCEKGGRAAKVSEVLRGAGFTVRHLVGDMSGWREAGLPIER